MRLLHVIPQMDPVMGGVCQAVRNIIAGLTDLGVSNEVVSLDGPGSELIYGDSFTLHSMGPGKGPWCYSKELVPWLINNFACFDAVIVHGLWLFHAYAVRKAYTMAFKDCSSRKLPKIFIMPHGMLDPYFQQARGRKLKAIRNWFYWKLIEKHMVNDAAGLLFTCKEELQLARHSFSPYRPCQEVVVGLGVNEPPVFLPTMKQAFLEKCPELQNRPYILFLSRIHEKKGVDILVEAFSEILHFKELEKGTLTAGGIDGTSETENDNLPILIIAGPGIESPYGRKIQKRIYGDELLKKCIFFPGMLTGDAKWGAFYGCEAFVLPSHQENFGIAIVEAMACAKPVLISDQVNIWREIADDGAGLIARDTTEDFRNELVRWWSLKEVEKLQIGQLALSCFRKNFSVVSASKNLLRNIG
ncbi:glycosyltransferase [Pleomorphovibrio marinus]|uniref:glycosyltransferase n=1 Tax=Pleomorphovibrio marinus TaxID=2164132 RepID=UPI000E0AFCD9|nr:glycosyltransferase [Pleomorphovibrio marinus]